MTAPTPRLPGFVIIGAVKAATTWIAHQLRAQPSIYMPMQEPHYFSTCYDRGPAWYAGLFSAAAAGQLIGEKSADYLAHPDAPARLARDLPAARLVVQLRNPIDRAYSDYCMLFRRGSVDGAIAQHLGGRSTYSRFLNDGLYARHLARFLDWFPAEQIKIMLYEDIKADPDQVLALVGRHIGATGELLTAAPETRQNDSAAPLLPLGLRRVAAPLKPLVAPLRRHSWFQGLHRSLARPAEYPPLTSDLRRQLQGYYAADVAGLAALIGRDLDAWLNDARPGR